jgi:hypothetical protein
MLTDALVHNLWKMQVAYSPTYIAMYMWLSVAFGKENASVW